MRFRLHRPGLSRFGQNLPACALIIVAVLTAAPAFAQEKAPAPQASRLHENPVALDGMHYLHVTSRGAILRDEYVRRGGGGGGGGIAGPCSVVASHTDANFAGGSFTQQAGFAEGEMEAASYVIAATAFPIKINLLEAIFVTNGATMSTITHWSVLVWQGTPQTGTLMASYSSDDVILPHIALPQGTNGAIVQFSIEPTDPEQIIIADNGTHTFSVGYRIDHHNQQTQNPCFSAPPTCCNAFPCTDVSGLQHPSDNWLFGVNCGPFGCPANGGWARFSALPSFCRPSGDWVMRATWSSQNCQPGVGACCATNGTCTSQLEQDCLSSGGTFQGTGTSCGGVNCPDQIGACCLPTGVCEERTQSSCTSGGGAFQGTTLGCPQVTCPQPTGACCFQATGGCVMLTQSNCAGAGGIYRGNGVSCTGLVCFPRGACCLPTGSCVANQSPEECTAQSGTFQGNATSCGSTNCPQPQGSCCFPNSFCLNLTQVDCANAGASWGGFGTNCNVPRFSQHPTSQTVCQGANVTFTVAACGSPSPTYQWQKNGVAIPGAVNATLTLTNVGSADAANYNCVASTGAGSAVSNTATLTVRLHCDSNCDGVVNNFDIDAFVLALTQGQTAWQQLYGCNYNCANDVSGDGSVNNFDIDPFVACLTGG